MKIIELRASNFKRLKAVTIAADGTLQVVAGRNAQGKTSVLDAIWWVLQQRAAGVDRPVRDGEDKATVSLTFEDLVVTRTTAGNGPGKLTITSRDGGATYPSPQKMLDSLVGKLTLDPLAFANAEPKKQVEILQGLVDLGFDPAEVERQRKTLYELRTDVGREAKKARGVVDSLPEPPADTPEFEVSAAGLADEIRRAEDVERRWVEMSSRFYAINEEIERLQAEQGALVQRANELGPQRRPDLAQLQQQLREVDEVNGRVRLRQQREHAAGEWERLDDQYEDLTHRLGQLEAWRKEQLAKAQMPVPGLGFDEDGVTFSGIPLSQASGAERLRVSTGIAMALNPEVRVIRISDGSLMDDDSMGMLTEMARERDFQLWVERVGTADGIGVVIEDGEVQA